MLSKHFMHIESFTAHTYAESAGVVSLTLLCLCAPRGEGYEIAPSSPLPPSLLVPFLLDFSPQHLSPNTHCLPFISYLFSASPTATGISEDRDLLSVSPQPRIVPGKQWRSNTFIERNISFSLFQISRRDDCRSERPNHLSEVTELVPSRA